MKFNCGPIRGEIELARQEAAFREREKLKAWHDFFALVPRQVASNDCRWLEVIERKAIFHRGEFSIPDSISYEYRAKGGQG